MRLAELQKALKKRFGCDWSFKINEEETMLTMENDENYSLSVHFFPHVDTKTEEEEICIDINGKLPNGQWFSINIHDVKPTIEDCLANEQKLWETYKKLSSL